LIDPDEYAYTPSFYGPTASRIIHNQLFGVVILFYWFVTDHEPFTYNSTTAEKMNWYQKQLGVTHPKLKQMIDIIYQSGNVLQMYKNLMHVVKEY
jgi:hypothetical protein